MRFVALWTSDVSFLNRLSDSFVPLRIVVFSIPIPFDKRMTFTSRLIGCVGGPGGGVGGGVFGRGGDG